MQKRLNLQIKMKRVLITEDDQFVANICRRHFEQAGFQVVLASDGATAIELLEQDRPDAVVLDLMLPGVDGIAVLRFIRSHAELRSLPVIILSNTAYFSGLAQSAWEAGATQFLNKGDQGPDALVIEVRKLLITAALPSTPRAWNDPPELPPRAFIKAASGPVQVIVVDDDKVIHGVLGFFMEQAGFVVRSAFNGRRALEMADANPPDIMVLDAKMPELDGLEVLKLLQRHPKLSKVPVIMLTAERDEALKAGALGYGAVEYLTKPFSPDKVVNLIDRYVGQRR